MATKAASLLISGESLGWEGEETGGASKDQEGSSLSASRSLAQASFLCLSNRLITPARLWDPDDAVPPRRGLAIA